MKTLLLLLLCLSVLLSSCMTVNTAYHKPEPGSFEDGLYLTLGGVGDSTICTLSGLGISVLLEQEPVEPVGRSRGWQITYPPGFYIGLVAGLILIVVDAYICSTLPYRKAYYHEKEAEEEEPF